MLVAAAVAVRQQVKADLEVKVVVVLAQQLKVLAEPQTLDQTELRIQAAAPVVAPVTLA
jgi:hypothetical protein